MRRRREGGSILVGGGPGKEKKGRKGKEANVGRRRASCVRESE